MEWWLLTFFLGAILSLFLPIVPEFSLLLLILILCSLLCCLKKAQSPIILILGACWVLIFANLNVNKLSANNIELTKQHKQNIIVRGEISSIVHPKSNNNRFNFIVSHWQNERLKVPFTIRLNWQEPTENLLQGQQWQFAIRLKPAHGLANVGGFSYKTWLMHNGIVATGYVKKDTVKSIQKSGRLNNHLLVNSETWRQRMYLKLKASLTKSPMRGLLLALGFGERAELTKEQWHVLSATATIHLIAISGLHIGIVAFFSLVIIKALFRYFPIQNMLTGKQHIRLMQLNIRYLPIVLSCLVAWYYAYLAGYSIPTLRALVMLFLYWFFRITENNVSLVRWFLLTIMVILLLWPLSLLSASFWLSVSALSIIFLTSSRFLNKAGDESNQVAMQHTDSASINGNYQTGLNFQATLNYLLNMASRLYRWGKALIIIQLALSICMLPIAALLNYQLPLMAFFANIIAVPLMSLTTIPLTLLSVLTMPISEMLSLFLLSLADKSMEIIWYWLSYLSEFTWAQLAISEAQLQLIFLVIACIFSIMYFRLSRVSSFFIASFIIIVLLQHHLTQHDEKQWQLSILDVGHGLAVVIEKDNHVFLYDTGAKYPSGFSMAEAAILPYLTSRGIKSIDGIIISHNDNDHGGGLAILREQITVKHVIANDLAFMPDSFCLLGNHFDWQGLHFEMLSPERFVGDKNDDSCVVVVTDGTHRVLLPGDISAKQERRLLNNATITEKLESDVLIAPHHGSKSSSSANFLASVNPTYAVFSTGYLNQWRMPSEPIMKKYNLQNIKTFNTAEQGMVTFTFKALAIEPITFRENIKPYWFIN